MALSSFNLRSEPSSTNPYINGLLGIQAFKQGYTITVVFQADPNDNGLSGGNRWAKNGAAEAFTKAAEAWGNVANVEIRIIPFNYHEGGDRSLYTWVETLDDLGKADGGGIVLGQHNLPQTGALGGTFNDKVPGFSKATTQVGGFNFTTFLHEIGHGLGLTHPHDGGPAQFPGVSDADDLGDNQLNTMLTTIMTYNDQMGTIMPPSDEYGWAATPMAFDIAAIQLIYGANMSYHTGDDVYMLPSVEGAGTYWQCIWDAGGTDTISAQNATKGTTIDLRAATLLNEVGGGGWASSPLGISGGFTIANGVIIENATGGAFSDTITGNNVANRLIGGGGGDRLYGLDGDDYLDGGDGDDTLEGGNGNDELIGGDGINLLKGGAGNDHLVGGSWVNTLYGDDGDDVIVSNGGGSDTVYGGAGNDQISGRGGTLDGGDGNDVITVSTFAGGTLIGGAGDDKLTGGTGSTLDGGDGNDILIGGNGDNILRGGAGNDTLTVGLGINKLDGGAGDDVLTGGFGFDTLDGGTGDDVMTGGIGNDIYYIDSLNDQFIEKPDEGIDTIYINRDFALSDVFENLNLIEGGKLGIGNAGNNIITATNIDASLYGLQGDDTISGSGHLYGDDGNDTLTATGLAPTYLDGGAGNDVLHGSGLADTLMGGAGNDLLDGGLGADQISGGDGDDELYGDARVAFDPNYDPYAGASMPTGPIGIGMTDNAIDTISGGAGNDLIYMVGAFYLTGSFTNSGSGLTPIHYASADIIDGGAGLDTVQVASEVDFQGAFTSIERFYFPHITYPNEAKYSQLGQPGVLILKGSQLSQIQPITTFAGSGTVQLDLSPNASLTGANWNFEAGAEMIVKINGGAGANAMIGTSHGTGSVEFDLDGGGAFSAAGWNFDGGAQTLIKINGGSGNNVLTGTSHADQLSGGAGNDLLIGGLGNDVMTGGDGDDVLVVAGRDQISGGNGFDTLILTDRAASYRLLQKNGEITLAGKTDGAAASTVERIQFSDQIVNIAQLSAKVREFNALAYIASYGDMIQNYGVNASAGLQHFISYGFAEGRSVSFDPLSYIASYSDMTAAFGINADEGARHYIQYGRAEGRTVTFDPLSYIASYSDMISAFGTNADEGVRHYIQYGHNEGRGVTFNPLAYIASYSDMISAFGTNADEGVRHYIQYGHAEGRTVTFDPLAYIASYSDMISAFGTNADAGVRHYIQYGHAEGRTVTFDPLAYIASYSDMMAAFGINADEGAKHYIQYGHAEGRTVTFDPLVYIASYRDLIGAFGTNAEEGARHYIQYGHAEGRQASFDPVAYLLSFTDLQAAHLGAQGALRQWLQTGAAQGRVGDALFGHEQVNHDLSNGSHANGLIDFTGDRDWYRIHATAGQSIDLHYASALADADLELHYADGGLVASAAISHGSSGSDLIYAAQQTDDYYLVVRPHAATDMGAYSLDLHLV